MKTLVPPALVPLIGQLSNLQFSTNLGELLAPPSSAAPVRAQEPSRTCDCGCERAVSETRKFVNQDHYNVWLSRLRYFGRNRPRVARETGQLSTDEA